jgi:hypothetical protein
MKRSEKVREQGGGDGGKHTCMTNKVHRWRPWPPSSARPRMEDEEHCTLMRDLGAGPLPTSKSALLTGAVNRNEKMLPPSD